MFYFTVVVFILLVLVSKQQFFWWETNQPAQAPRAQFVSKVTTFGPRRERTKANSMRSLEKRQLWLPKKYLKNVLSYVFQAIFCWFKRRSTDSYSLAACRWGISSLKDSLSTVTFVWYVILLPFATTVSGGHVSFENNSCGISPCWNAAKIKAALRRESEKQRNPLAFWDRSCIERHIQQASTV